MKKIKKSVKTAVISGLVLTSAAGIAYAEANSSKNKSADVENKLKLDVQKIDSDTVKVSIDNVKDIPKSMQFSIKLDGAELKDGENSIKDLVKEEVATRLKNNEYLTKTNSILTDYTYNESENTIDVLITSENSLPKIGDKIEIFELDIEASSSNNPYNGEVPTYRVVPNKEESYKYVSNTNKEYSGLGVTYDDVSITMNVAPTITSNGKYIEIIEGETLTITADVLGIAMEDKDGEDGLKLEVRNKSKNDKNPITEFIENTPGIYELECIAVDNYNEKSEPVIVQVNVVADENAEAPVLVTKDGEPLTDITINAGEIFKPLDYVNTVDAKGRELEIKVSIDKELDLDPETNTDYFITYEATNVSGKTTTKQIKLTVLANNAPVIKGVKDHTLKVGDEFDPRKGVTVTDEDDDIELNVESNVNTNIVGTYQVLYSATDKQGKTTRVMSKVVVNPRPSLINRIPEIMAEDKTITVGDKFEPLEGVTATDKEDGILTHKIVVLQNNVDTQDPGRYTVTYSVTDSKGAKATKTITVIVNPKAGIINHAPELNVSDKTLKVGDDFDPLEGVTATDKEDDDSTLEIKVIKNNVRTDKAGVYTVTYSVTDSQGAKTVKTITVTVNPKFSLINSAPEIFAKNKNIYIGDKFDTSTALEGVTATDKEDGNLTSEIKVIENNVDTTKAGIYTVKYSVSDSKGATTIKQITVIVNEKPVNHAPEIIANDRTIILGSDFDPLDGVVATDIEDGDITSSIKVIENNVNTAKEGKYTVKYSVSDSEGETSTKEITVTVKRDIILAENITINNKFDNKMYIENTKVITASINEEADIKDIEWTISDESIATLEVVGYDARIVAKAEGKVTVTARTKDGSNKSDSITLNIIDFKNDDELPAYIKDIIDTDIILPIANAATGEEDSPLEFEVKNVTGDKIEDLLEKLKDLSPVLKSVRQENGFKVYKIRLTKKSGLFRIAKYTYNDDYTYIEIKVNNKLDHADEINYILSQLQAEAPEKPEVNQKPTIVVEGLNNVITVGDKFNPLAGVTAYDKDGKDITSNIKVSGTVDTSKAGKYELVYTVTDSEGRSSSMTVIITVIENKVELEKPENPGTEGSTKPQNPGEPNTENSNAGTTKPNSSSNVVANNDEEKIQDSEESVVENSKPVIKVTSTVDSITVGDEFNPLDGVTAYDEEDGDLTHKISVSGTVDTSKAGKYELVYTVEDKNGNKSTFTRVITVNEKETAIEENTEVVSENKSNSIIAIVVGSIAVVGAAIAGCVLFLRNKKK